MQDASPSKPYSVVSRIIHWLTALIILGLLVVGTYMTQLDVSEQKLQLYNLHKSFGLLVLALAFVRILWHVITKKPKSLPSHKRWEKILSHMVHGFLYLLLFALPLSGWVMSSAGDFNIKFFSLNMPDIVAKDEALFKLSHEMHEVFAWVLMGFLALHIAGALKHHVIDRDETLERMTWSRPGFLFIGLLVCFLGGVYGYVVLQVGLKAQEPAKQEEVVEEVEPVVEEALPESEVEEPDEEIQKKVKGIFIEDIPEWTVNTDKSTLNFQATQYGQTFEGSFDFDGKIFFDQKQLEKSAVRIEIDIASIKTGSMDRDSQAKSKDWFDVETYPIAVFEADQFEQGDEDNSYNAKGFLTLRDVRLPITLPFDLNIDKDEQGLSQAQMKATIDLNRLDFGVGQGQWQKTDAISDKVTINIDLFATTN